MEFRSQSYGRVDEKSIARIICDEIASAPDRAYVIAVGSDSQNTRETRMVAVIALQRVGYGGVFFYRINHLRRIPSMNQRLFTEAQYTVEVALNLIQAFEDISLEEDFFFEDYDVTLEIHCDVGGNGRSKQMLQEISGYVHGTTRTHYRLKTKPDAFAASAIADRLSK